MKTRASIRSGRRLGTAAGVSLLETVFALMLLLVVSLGLMPLGVIATTTTENQGHLMARVTEYAQDKLEQLLALAYLDTISDTRAVITTDTGGSGLTPGGSSDPNAPVALYVDYLNAEGTLLPNGGVPADWYYKRVWQIEIVKAGLKRITVVAITKNAVGSVGRIPRATVMSLKSDPF